jgi:hypothetical protein
MNYEMEAEAVAYLNTLSQNCLRSILQNITSHVEAEKNAQKPLNMRDGISGACVDRYC